MSFPQYTEHQKFLSYIDNYEFISPRQLPFRIILGKSDAQKGIAVYIEDPLIIKYFMQRVSERVLVGVPEYQKNKPLGFGYNINIKIEYLKQHISGDLKAGGKESEGFGFLIEREEDFHWFHGAWDPWPVKAYWVNVFPYEWLQSPPNSSLDTRTFEIFSLLFFTNLDSIRGVDVFVSKKGIKYSARNPGDTERSEAENDLLKVGSLREFIELHPDLKIGYNNQFQKMEN